MIAHKIGIDHRKNLLVMILKTACLSTIAIAAEKMIKIVFTGKYCEKHKQMAKTQPAAIERKCFIAMLLLNGLNCERSSVIKWLLLFSCC